MKVDYIVVGLGLAGIAFAEELLKHNKTFVVFEDNSQQSSIVAGGVYNPVILKRFTPVWNATAQLERALPLYESIEQKLNIQVDEKLTTKKIFKSIEDQNNWFAAADNPNMACYLDPKIDFEKYKTIVADFGLGNVLETGWVDTKKLVQHYRDYLAKEKKIQFETFDYDAINHSDDAIQYKDILANRIVFCEGFGVKKNPFFKEIPLNGTKGETMIIKAPELQINFQIKSTVFVLPLGDDLYKVGATFNWKDKTSKPTEEGKEELVEKLKKVIRVPYKIVYHSAGIRPTTKDRKPLVGVHPEHKNLAVLNGLGTRGVMIAPTVAHELYQHLENNKPLDTEIDIKRFN